MNIFQHLIADGEKFLAWAQTKEPAALSALAQAGKLSTEVMSWSKTPEAQTIEAVVESVIPASAAVFPEVLAVVTELATELPKLTSIKAIEAVGERLGGEVLSILDGKKLPTGISGYIAEFQSLFTA